MSGVRTRNFGSPDEVSRFSHGTAIEVHLGELVVGKQVLEPGWRWSTAVKPIVGTPSCRYHHNGVVLSGRLHVRADDGTEGEYGADTVYDVQPGHDAWVVGDEPAVLIEWAGVHRWAEPPAGERILATVLFTDIVDSTAIAARLGDAAWTRLLDEHDATVRSTVDRFRGELVTMTGDGMLAIFDGPGRAVMCGVAMRDAFARLELWIRAGIHTGEIEVVPGNVHGVAVHVAARIMALAGPGEIFVSATTRDLIAAGDMRFEDRGFHELKGLEGVHSVFAVAQPAS